MKMDTPDHIPVRPKITVFAGSGTPQDSQILLAAETLGQRLGEAGYDLIYGGGTMGVMGAVAAAAQKAGAQVTAVTLQKYAQEPQLDKAEVFVVEDESARFKLLTTHGNPVAFFVLPGGPGSLREALQGLEMAVYENGPPVILVQVDDYLDGISHYFNRAVESGLIKKGKEHCLKLWSPQKALPDFLDLSSKGMQGTPPVKPKPDL